MHDCEPNPGSDVTPQDTSRSAPLVATSGQLRRPSIEGRNHPVVSLCEQEQVRISDLTVPWVGVAPSMKDTASTSSGQNSLAPDIAKRADHRDP